jgi:hypothetical protein
MSAQNGAAIARRTRAQFQKSFDNPRLINMLVELMQITNLSSDVDHIFTELCHEMLYFKGTRGGMSQTVQDIEVGGKSMQEKHQFQPVSHVASTNTPQDGERNLSESERAHQDVLIYFPVYVSGENPGRKWISIRQPIEGYVDWHYHRLAEDPSVNTGLVRS